MFATSRTIYGFLSQSSQAYNIALPWRLSVQDGLFAMNYDLVDAVEDDLKMWANTNWGDRPMYFFFGLDARRHLFEQQSEAKQSILQNAREQLPKYFPFVKILKLEVITSEEDDTLQENSIRFRLEGSLEEDPYKTVNLDQVIGI